jgi:hypothetical protein
MFFLIAGGMVLACGVATWFWQSDDRDQPTPRAQTSSPAAREVRLGPGIWTAEAASADRHAGDTLQPLQRPNATADGKLIIDQTLHQVIDFYLLGGLPGDRTMHAMQLRAYLNRTLPAAASREASQVVDRYLLYMNLHDDLLTRQALPQWVDLPTPAEAERISNWVGQRTRLRQTILGQEVVQAWYAEEEAAIQAGLAEFDTRGSLAVMVPSDGRPVENEANMSRAARMLDAGREARREQFLRQLTEEASKSYVVVEHERQLSAARAATPAS